MADTRSTPPGTTPLPPTPIHDAPTNTLKIVPLLVKFFKGSALILLVWFLGYFNLSALWGMIVFFLYLSNEEYKKLKESKKKYAYQAAKNEKQAILARMEELPSWVFFPDVERAEWMNHIIKQMWPYIGQYVHQILKEKVEPKVKESLPSSLKSFKFVRIDLGDIAPRIGGVKAYANHVRRDEILLDFEINYASDSNIKVSIKGLEAGIKDLQIQGTMRVVMKPLVKVMPLIGGISVFFLNNPSIDFDLTDLANAFDFPGLSDLIREIVVEQVANFMVLPNRIPIQLAENIDILALKYPMPHGVLRIHCLAARDLKAADLGLLKKGKSDPYCKLFVGAQSFKTKVIQNTIQPVWNQFFEAVVDQRFGQYLEVDVMDEDPGEDDELGSVAVELQAAADQGGMDSWFPLEGVKTGMVHLRLLWLHLSNDPEQLEKGYDSRLDYNFEGMTPSLKSNYQVTSQLGTGEESLSAALLMVYLDAASNLPRGKKSMTEPSPYVMFQLGNETKRSTVKQNTTNPQWEENYLFLVHNPQLQDLFIQIRNIKKDKKQLKTLVSDDRKEKAIGNVAIPLKQLLTARDLTIHRPFLIKDAGPETRLTLRLCLRILTAVRPPAPAADHTSSSVTDEPVADSPEPSSMASSPPISSADDSRKTTPVENNNSIMAQSPKERVVETVKRESSENVQSAPRKDVTPDSDNVSVASTTPSMSEFSADLRKRAVSSKSSESGEFGLGRLQLTLRYSYQRSKLVVVVHKCMNLLAVDDDNFSDPYVRMYLLPDKGSKRKTGVIKNNLNPVWDETFEWSLDQRELTQRTLEVCVKNTVGVFSKGRSFIGKVEIDFSQFDPSQPVTQWYDLEPPDIESS